MRAQRQPARCLRFGLVLCLLALSHGARAQGIFELLTGPTPSSTPSTTTTTTGAETTTPTTTTTTTPTTTPATGSETMPTTEGSITPTTTTTTPTTTTGFEGVTPTEGSTTTTTPTPSPTTTTTTTPTPRPTTTTTTTPTPSPTTTTTTTPTPSPTTTTTTTPTPSPTTTTTTTTTSGSPPAVGTPSTEAPSFGELPSTTTTTTGAPPVANVSGPPVATPSVAMAPGSDAAAVEQVGTVEIVVPSPPVDVLPPAPPEGWAAMQKDIALVFSVEIRGKYIVPFTTPKAVVMARVLRDRYIRSAATPDITVAALNTFTYLSYDSPYEDADPMATGTSPAPAGGRRLAAHRTGAGRDLLQLEKSGAELKITVATAGVRVDSEIESFIEGVDSGKMAADFTLAGVEVDNVTLLVYPFTEELIGPGNQEGDGSSGGVKVWVIATVVGVILLLLPVPLYFFVRWRKRKHKEAIAIQQAEAEVARQRMQSRMMKPGSKSFSLRPGGGGSGSAADIMVRSGSAGGLAGFANNGRLHSWNVSGPNTGRDSFISRQTSMTSLGSAMPSARGASSYGMPPRLPSLPGQQRAGPVSMPIAADGYAEELASARSARMQQQQE